MEVLEDPVLARLRERREAKRTATPARGSSAAQATPAAPARPEPEDPVLARLAQRRSQRSGPKTEPQQVDHLTGGEHVPRATIGPPVEIDQAALRPKRSTFVDPLREGYQRGMQGVAGAEALREQTQMNASAPSGLPPGLKATIGLPLTSAEKERVDVERGLNIVEPERHSEVREQEYARIESGRQIDRTSAEQGRREAVRDVAERQRVIDTIPKSEVTERVLNLETKDPLDWVRASLDLGLSSLAQAVPTITGGGVGAQAGGPVGAAVGAGVTSFATEYGASFLEGLQRQGVDLSDPAAVEAALGNQAVVDEASERALTRAATISGVDAATGGALGKIGKTLATRSLRRGARVAVRGGQIGGEVASEGGGEALAGYLADGEVDGREVLGEVLGSIGGQGAATVEAINAGVGAQTSERTGELPAPRVASGDVAVTLQSARHRLGQIQEVIGKARPEDQVKLSQEYARIRQTLVEAGANPNSMPVVQSAPELRAEAEQIAARIEAGQETDLMAAAERLQQLQDEARRMEGVEQQAMAEDQQRREQLASDPGAEIEAMAERRRQRREERARLGEEYRQADRERELKVNPSATPAEAVTDDVAELIGGQMEALRERIHDPNTPRAERVEMIADYQALERLSRARPQQQTPTADADAADSPAPPDRQPDRAEANERDSGLESDLPSAPIGEVRPMGTTNADFDSVPSGDGAVARGVLSAEPSRGDLVSPGRDAAADTQLEPDAQLPADRRSETESAGQRVVGEEARPAEGREGVREEGRPSIGANPGIAVDAVRGESTTVEEVSIGSLSTDEARFQPRGKAFAEESARRVAEDFDRQKLDPVTVWRDPTDGKRYVLGGHSRLEGQRRRQAQGLPDSDTLPIREFTGTEAEAREFAATDNDRRSQMQPSEQAAFLREWSDGRTKAETQEQAQKLYGKNAQTVQDLAALSPKGRALSYLERFAGADTAESRDMLTAAQWVGRARRQNDQLTDAHERELYDYLLKNWRKKPHTRSMGGFAQFVREVTDRRTEFGDGGTRSFDASKPLNVESVTPQSQQERALDEAARKADRELKDAQAELERQRRSYVERGATTDQLASALRPYDAAVTVAQRRAIEARQNLQKKGEVRRSQMALLSGQKDLDRGDGTYLGALVIERSPFLDGDRQTVEREAAEALEADVEGFVQRYTEHPESDGGRIISADIAKELFEAYTQDPGLHSSSVHEPASSLAKEVFRRRLADASVRGKPVAFTAGGPGSGKSSVLEGPLGESLRDAHTVYDATLASYGSSKVKLLQVLQAGGHPVIYFVDRSPERAADLAVLRAIIGMAKQREGKGSGPRTVPLFEVGKKNYDARKTVLRLEEEFGARLSVFYIENNGGIGDERATTANDVRNRQPESREAAAQQAVDAFGEIQKRHEKQGNPIPEGVVAGFLPDAESRGGGTPEGHSGANGQGGPSQPPRVGNADGSRDGATSGPLGQSPQTLDRSEARLDRNAPPTKARVQPAPLPGYDGRKTADMIVDLDKLTGVKVKRSKKTNGAAGSYYPGSARTVIRFPGDVDTAAHEVAHALDDRFGILGDWANQTSSPFDGELIPAFSGHGSTPRKAGITAKTYERAEGVAEWVRAWMFNPDAARLLAPQFAAHFEQKVPQEVRDGLREYGDDVRRWAGAPAEQRLLANVAVDVREPSAIQKVAAALQSGDPDRLTFNWLDQKRAAWDDRLWPLLKAEMHARALQGLDPDAKPGESAYKQARLFSGINPKIERAFENGMITADGKTARGIGGGIEWLFEPAQSNEDASHAVALMIAERVMELEAMTEADGSRRFSPQKADRIAGIGAGLESDVKTARQTIESLRADGERYARLAEMGRRYRLWADALLKYALDSGRISQAQYDGIRENHHFYASLARVDDSEGGDFVSRASGSMTSAKDVVTRLMGSTKQIESPYTSLLVNTIQTIQESDRNKVMRTFTDMLRSNRAMYQGDALRLADVGHQVERGDGENTFRVFVDGKEEFWEMAQPEVAKALRGIESTIKLEGAVKAINTFTVQAQRAAITLAPGFAVRNKLRDTKARAINSKHGGPAGSELKYLTPEGRKRYREGYEELMLSGGGMFGYFGGKEDLRGVIKQAIEKASGEKSTVVGVPGKIWNGWKGVLEHAEASARVDEYQRAKKAYLDAGWSEVDAKLQAALDARDLIDFARAGHTAKQVNQWIIFFNAAIQGMSVHTRGWAGDPKKMALRMMLWAWAPALASYAWNAYTGDDEEERQQPAYIRDLFDNYKMPSGIWLRIPKNPDEAVSAAFIERMLDVARGKANAFEGYGKTIMSAALPVEKSMLAGPFGPEVDMMTNYDFFRERNIVPTWEADLDLELREGTNRASRMGQALQAVTQAVPGRFADVDARKWDHWLRSRGGGFAQIAQTLSDAGREDRPMQTRRLAGQMVGLITDSPSYSAADVQWVMSWSKRRGEASDDRVQQLRDSLTSYREETTGRGRDRAAADARRLAGTIRAQVEAEEEVLRGKGQIESPEGARVRARVWKGRYNELRRKPEAERTPSEQTEYEWMSDWKRDYDDRMEAAEEFAGAGRTDQAERQRQLAMSETNAMARSFKRAGVEIRPSRRYADYELFK